MNKKMTALQAFAPFEYRIEEIDIATVEAGAFLMKVHGSGRCASDTKTVYGGNRVCAQSPEAR